MQDPKDVSSTPAVTNVAERSHAAEDLRRERDLLAAVLDTAATLVVVLDRTGRIVRFNRACERLTGYLLAEARGKLLWDFLLVPEEVERVKAVFAELQAGQFPNRFENLWQTRDGSVRLIDWANTAILDDRGAVAYVVGTGIDITERRQTEASLRQAHNELEQRVAERTAELQARLTSEALVARISSQFVNLGPADIDAGIEHALQSIGQVAGADRSYLFQFSGDGTILNNTHEWCAEGIQSYMHVLKGLPRTAFPWFVSQLEHLHAVSVPRVADLPPEARRERAECEREGIRSLVLVPLAYRGSLAGFLGFDAVRTEREWANDTIALLEIAAGIIVNALEHKRGQAIQAGQRQFLELLATGGDFSKTLHSLVQLIERQWPGMLGLILLLDEDGRRLHIGASVSLPQDYVESIEGLEIGPMVGSCGTACYRRERVIVEDTATDPRWEGLRDLALRHNLRACWSEPVLSPDGHVVGTFAMYYRQPRAPTEAELRAIEMGAHLVGVAVEHRRAERALRDSEEKFRGIVEHANIGIAIVQDYRFRFLNPHFASMLGYTVDELLGTEFMRLCTPDEHDRVVGFHTRRVHGEPAPARYETAMLHKNGQRVYPEVSAGMIPYGGQPATFVCLRDITEQKQAEQALRALVEFEDAIAKVSGTFINLMPEQVDEGITRALQTIGQAYHVERAYVFQFSTDRALMRCTHEWCAEEIRRQVSGLREAPTERFRWTVEQILQAAVVQVRSPADVPRRARAERAEFRAMGLQSRLVVPMIYHGVPVGFVGFDSTRARSWTEQSLKVQVIGDIFANALEQKRAQEALQQAYGTLERRVAERTRELSTLLDVSKNLAARLELEPLLSSILDELKSVVDYEGCMVFALEGDTLVPRAHRGRLPQEKALSLRWDANGPLDQLVLQGKEPVLVTDTRGNSPAAQAYRASVGALQETLYPHIGSWLGVPLIAKGQVIGELALDHSRPGFFTPTHAGLAMAFANQAATAMENARLYAVERERHNEAERRRRVAEGMRDIVAVLNSPQPLDQALQSIARLACQVMDSQAVALFRLGRDGVLRILASCGLEADYAAGMAMPLGQGGAGRALVEKRAVPLPDAAAFITLLERQGLGAQPEAAWVTQLLKRGLCALLAVPLIIRGEDYGAITLYYGSPHEFSEEEMRLAMSVADQVALAIENARLREQAGQAGAMEERSRLARELHDSVTQSLYSVTMYTEAAARLITTGHESGAAEYLREARDTAQEALREMRLLIYQLRPPVLEKGGLAVALQVRLDAVERRGGMRAELVVEGEDRLPPAVQAELHQIAQEALNNALKHAHARQVKVRLSFSEATTLLEVEDDGAGFDPATAAAGGGLGLRGMQERAQKIGGRLQISSAPGRGTRITVEAPSGGRT